jgi:hypothetical protein
MSLNFPAFPARGERFTDEGRTFIWNGAVWLLQPESIPWATLEEALAGVSADTIMSPATMRAAIEASEPPPPNFGPMTCKARARWTASTGAILSESNIASIAVGPEGFYAFTFRQPLPSADYIVHGSCRFSNTAAFTMGIRVGVDQTVNGFSILSAFTGGSGVVGTPRWGNSMAVAVFQ